MAHDGTFIDFAFERLSPQEQRLRSRQFYERMKTRRTIRAYSREPVPFEFIKNAIATAGTAPSGANQQPWTFVVVSNAALKREIRIAAEAEEKESYERRMSAEWLAALAPLGTTWQKPHLEAAPHLIVVFRQVYGWDADGRKIKHYYVDESVGIATGMLIASLHIAGLVTLTHTPSPMKFLGDLLDRPRNERATMILAVGYPAEGVQVPRITKKPLDDILIHLD